MQVIVAMKGMIRAAENSRDHLHAVDKVAGRALSTNPLEQWLTGRGSQHVEARAAFEEPASPLYASRSPILRHVGKWLLDHTRTDRFNILIFSFFVFLIAWTRFGNSVANDEVAYHSEPRWVDVRYLIEAECKRSSMPTDAMDTSK